MKEVYWIGQTPKCDAGNGHKLNGVFFDARVPSIRQWAILCPSCAARHGISHETCGVGKGQKYRQQDDGRWLKVAG